MSPEPRKLRSLGSLLAWRVGDSCGDMRSFLPTALIPGGIVVLTQSWQLFSLLKSHNGAGHPRFKAQTQDRLQSPPWPGVPLPTSRQEVAVQSFPPEMAEIAKARSLFREGGRDR